MTSTKQPPAPNGDESTSPLAGAGLPDPSGTRIVLIGAGRFNELHPLPATRRNVEDLADLITAAWNLPVANCTVLRDPASPRDLSRAVEEAAKEATDTLLVYYAGHGLIDWSGHFHLAVRSSERESVHDTAVPYAWVKEHIEKSRAERRIVILDCCYAARAFGLQSDSALFEVAGTYVLAAASETATAVSPPGEEFTAFTGALLTVLRNGIPGLPRYLDLDSIFRRLSKELTLRNRPRPSKQCRDHLGYTPFIRNAAYAPYGDASLSAVPAQQRPPSETSGTGTPPSYTSATSRADAVPRRTANISDDNPIQVMRRKAVRLVGLPAAALALLLGDTPYSPSRPRTPLRSAKSTAGKPSTSESRRISQDSPARQHLENGRASKSTWHTTSPRALDSLATRWSSKPWKRRTVTGCCRTGQ